MFPDGANEEQAGTGLEEREREKISFWRWWEVPSESWDSQGLPFSWALSHFYLVEASPSINLACMFLKRLLQAKMDEANKERSGDTWTVLCSHAGFMTLWNWWCQSKVRPLRHGGIKVVHCV
jgi:hypothetical protein